MRSGWNVKVVICRNRAITVCSSVEQFISIGKYSALFNCKTDFDNWIMGSPENGNIGTLNWITNKSSLTLPAKENNPNHHPHIIFIPDAWI